jgi:hypothetical protein
LQILIGVYGVASLVPPQWLTPSSLVFLAVLVIASAQLADVVTQANTLSNFVRSVRATFRGSASFERQHITTHAVNNCICPLWIAVKRQCETGQAAQVHCASVKLHAIPDRIACVSRGRFACVSRVQRAVQVDMLIPGVAPGSITTNYLLNAMIIVRLIGAVCMLVLFVAAKLADEWMFQLAGVRVSAIEILIVTGTLTSCAQIVRSYTRLERVSVVHSRVHARVPLESHALSLD